MALATYWKGIASLGLSPAPASAAVALWAVESRPCARRLCNTSQLQGDADLLLCAACRGTTLKAQRRNTGRW